MFSGDASKQKWTKIGVIFGGNDLFRLEKVENPNFGEKGQNEAKQDRKLEASGEFVLNGEFELVSRKRQQRQTLRDFCHVRKCVCEHVYACVWLCVYRCACKNVCVFAGRHVCVWRRDMLVNELQSSKQSFSEWVCVRVCVCVCAGWWGSFVRKCIWIDVLVSEGLDLCL